MIKSKYTMIMLKLIEAKRFGDRNTINIEQYSRRLKEWFLVRAKNWTTARSHTSIECGIEGDWTKLH